MTPDKIKEMADACCLARRMDGISEAEADMMIQIISRFYQIMCERKMQVE